MPAYYRYGDPDIVEDLLADLNPGAYSDEEQVARFIAELRASTNGTRVAVTPELAAVFASGIDRQGVTVLATPASPRPTRRRRRVLESLGVFVATAAGKLVLGTAAVAASVGGAHAAGVVDVPGLPDRTPPAVEAPVLDDAANTRDSQEDGRDGRPESPGVDGGVISERATSGEPREGGKAFGTSVADEASGGALGEDASSRGREIADEHRPDAPSGSDIAEEHKPQSPAPAAPADENRPTDPPADGDAADEHRPAETGPAASEQGGSAARP